MLYNTFFNILKTYTPIYSYNFCFNSFLILLVILLNDLYFRK